MNAPLPEDAVSVHPTRSVSVVLTVNADVVGYPVVPQSVGNPATPQEAVDSFLYRFGLPEAELSRSHPCLDTSVCVLQERAECE